ncbi:hypothetical protein [Nocardioides convexus]|uniref:hypothetical protein n=1 Tax=Nocardioides convexus TaxID=2712224 RepID=UPI002418B2E0|nr:hypothetical protein [Nocardioides convexus]
MTARALVRPPAAVPGLRHAESLAMMRLGSPTVSPERLQPAPARGVRGLGRRGGSGPLPRPRPARPPARGGLARAPAVPAPLRRGGRARAAAAAGRRLGPGGAGRGGHPGPAPAARACPAS